jgi:L-alanine-DL-glutamate epimerase-like enolase superfamily enzyme
MLRAEMRGYLDRGYNVVKMKIGGAPLEDDLRRIEAVLEVVGDGERLAVDANGRFDTERALAYADALAPYGLRWYEEPGDPLDFELQARVAERYDGPMATGENLFSMQDARNLARYAGMRPDRDLLQMDPALSYGLVEYLRTLEALGELGWSPLRMIPHGGHQMALSIAAGLGLGGNESYPDVFAPFGGFADDTPVIDGRVGLPDAPGVGFERKAQLWDLLRALA